MITSLMIFQAIVSVLLILMVLLQFGKGAEAGLMSSASDSIFTSSQQGNILTKITTILAILFLGNSILLAKLQSQRSSESLFDSVTPIAQPLNSDQKKIEEVSTPAPEVFEESPSKEEAPTKE